MKTLNERIAITLDYMEPAETYPGNGDICITKMHFLEIRQLIKDVQAELEKREWKDISSAPIAKRILMWWTPINKNPYAEAAIIGEISIADEDYLAKDWKPSKYWDGQEYKDLSRITHYMPLPTPPNEDK